MLEIAIASALAGFIFGRRLGIMSLLALSVLAAVTGGVLAGGGILAGIGVGAAACATFQLAAFGAMLLHDGNGPRRTASPARRSILAAAPWSTNG